MCRPTDQPTPIPSAVASTSSSSSSEAQLAQQPQELQLDRKKLVRFADDLEQVQEFRMDLTDEEKPRVWMTNEDYRVIRVAINATARTKAMGLSQQLHAQDAMHCWRGLEFLKHDDGTPSRKERRLKYMKDVLLHYRCLLKKNQSQPHTAMQQLSAFCAHVSKDSQRKALDIAAGDFIDARDVYHESQFIYADEYGHDVHMFSSSSPPSSQTMRKVTPCCPSSSYTPSCRDEYYAEQQLMVLAFDVSPLLRFLLPCAF